MAHTTPQTALLRKDDIDSILKWILIPVLALTLLSPLYEYLQGGSLKGKMAIQTYARNDFESSYSSPTRMSQSAPAIKIIVLQCDETLGEQTCRMQIIILLKQSKEPPLKEVVSEEKPERALKAVGDIQI